MAGREVLTVRQPDKPVAGGELLNLRELFDRVVAEISSLTQTTRSRFMPVHGRRKRTRIHRLWDSYGGRAAEVLNNGMTSGLSSPSRPWFKTKVPDPDLMRFHSVKTWLGAVDRIMYDFMAATNFYGALKAGYGELGLFGTEAAFMEEHWRVGMVTHSMTFGEFTFSLSDELVPDSLLRWCPMTARQMVGRFAASAFDKREVDWSRVSIEVRTAWDAGNYEQCFDVMHLVEPNPAWDPARFDAKGKPYRSVYWEERNNQRVLEATGHSEKPFWCARWEVTGNETWGVGPGWKALPDLRAAQLQAKRKGDATDYAIKPPIVAPASPKLKMEPGAVTHSSQMDKDKVFPIWQADYRAIDVVGKDLKECYRNIDGHFYVDLFLAITQMDGVQPRNNEEIFSRNEEKLSQLGPVIERVNNEKLGVAIDRVFGVCLRRGLFPPPPPELHNMELQVDYISILAQAQRAVGLSVVERSLGFVGSMSRAFPSAADNIDSDAIVLDYLERSGFPVIGIRDPAQRDQLRAQRAREMAAQQARESMPALKQAAEGAELLSRTDLRGQSILDALAGGVGG
jgi:hypothetical protein